MVGAVRIRVSVIRYGRKQKSEDTNKPSSPIQLTLQLTREPLPHETAKEPKPDRPSKWADLMQRAFKVDLLACDCGGRLQFIDCYCERKQIDEILRSLGMSEAESQSSQQRAPPEPRDNGPLFRHGK